MASVHLKPGSKFYFAFFNVWDAERHTWKQASRSTFSTDEKKASAVALEYERIARLASGEGSSRITRQHVLDTVNSILRISGVQLREEAPLWGEYAAQWLRERERETKPRTLVAYAAAIRKFGHANLPLDAITPTVARAYVATLATKESASVRAMCGPLSRIMERARDEGLVSRNPFAGAVPKRSQSANVRLTFTREDVVKLLKHATGDWKTLILLGLCTGARIGDCAAMTAGNIHGDSIQWTPAKKSRKGKPVVLPLVEPLASHIRTLPASGPLCPELSKVEISGRNGLSCKFGEVLKAAGIDTGESATSSGRMWHARTFHSLRHTLATWLAETGAEESLRRRIVDHESAAVHAGYLHYGIETLRQSLTRALSGKSPAPSRSATRKPSLRAADAPHKPTTACK